MIAKCPKCGYAEEVEGLNIGDLVECPCGNKYQVGYAKVQPKDFSRVYADVRCPYCDAVNALPSEAVNKNVRCGTCGEKFHVTGEAPTLTKNQPQEQNLPQKSQAAKAHIKISSAQLKKVAGNNKPTDPKEPSPVLETAHAIAKILASIMAIVMALVLVAIFAGFFDFSSEDPFHKFKNQTGKAKSETGSSWPLVWVDDDVCTAKYIRALSNKDYAAARRWANRMKDDINRKSALKVIDGTEKGLKAMGLERNKLIQFPY